MVHLRAPSSPHARSELPAPPKVGFVVSKAVGPAVTRNRVKRRLRHLARARTGALPARGMLVVRALPAAADASYDELGRELDRCLSKLGVAVDPAVKVEVSR